MTMRKMMMTLGAVVCFAAGYLVAYQVDEIRYRQLEAAQRQRAVDQAAMLHNAAEKWAETLARSQGEAVLQAFTAGIAASVMAQRSESVEMAAVSLLYTPGVSGIHVLQPDGKVLYSSDAKLTATGSTEYRGGWALQATGLVSRPSPRAGVMDFALPVARADQRLAVVWLEYDVTRTRDSARPTELQTGQQDSGASSAPALPES